MWPFPQRSYLRECAETNTNKRWCVCFYGLHCFISQLASWKMTSWRTATALHTWKVELSESFQFLIRMNGHMFFFNIRRQTPTLQSIFRCSWATWGSYQRTGQLNNKQFDKNQSLLQTTTQQKKKSRLAKYISFCIQLTFWNNWY